MQRYLFIVLSALAVSACGGFGLLGGGEPAAEPEPAAPPSTRAALEPDPRDAQGWTLFRSDPAPRKPTETLAGRSSVVSGDILRVDDAIVFLSGVDAPEPAQLCRRDNGLPYRCGQDVIDILRQRLQRDRIICEVAPVERAEGKVYEGTCSHLGTEINDWLVRNGHAVARNRYSPYLEQERRAEEEGRGLWAGSFEQPREWRRRNR